MFDHNAIIEEIERAYRMDPYDHQIEFLIKLARKFHRYYLTTGSKRALAAREVMIYRAKAVKRDRKIRDELEDL
jgi:hypothetical protein